MCSGGLVRRNLPLTLVLGVLRAKMTASCDIGNAVLDTLRASEVLPSSEVRTTDHQRRHSVSVDLLFVRGTVVVVILCCARLRTPRPQAVAAPMPGDSVQALAPPILATVGCGQQPTVPCAFSVVSRVILFCLGSVVCLKPRSRQLDICESRGQGIVDSHDDSVDFSLQV